MSGRGNVIQGRTANNTYAPLMVDDTGGMIAADTSRRDFGVVMAERAIESDFGDTASVIAKNKSLLKFGSITNLGTSRSTIGTWGSGEINETYVTTNAITHFASSDGGDTGDMVVEGHTVSGTGTDAEFTFVVQTVTLDGQTKTALTTPLARCSRVYNTTGTEWVGDIYIAQDVTFTSGVPQTASAIHMVVPAGEQQSFKAATTISNADYYILSEFLVSVGKKTNAVVDFRLEIRRVGGVFRPVSFATVSDGNSVTTLFNPPVIVPKNADVRLTAEASTTNVAASGWFNGYLALVTS